MVVCNENLSIILVGKRWETKRYFTAVIVHVIKKSIGCHVSGFGDISRIFLWYDCMTSSGPATSLR